MKRAIHALLILTLFLCTRPGFALDSDEEASRTLAGYRFVVSQALQGPFIASHFHMETGPVTTQGLEFPAIVVDTTLLVSVQGDYMYLLSDISYQHAVNERLAMSINLNGATRMGTNTGGLLARGVSAVGGWGVGGLFQLWRNDRAMVSAEAGVGTGSMVVVDVAGYLEEVLNGNLETATAVRTDRGTTYSAGLRAALATSHWVGFMANAGIRLDDYGVNSDVTNWHAAAGTSMDFAQRGSVPLGLLLKAEIGRSATQAFDAGTSRNAMLGVYYTGRTDFQAGFQSTWASVALRDLDTTFELRDYLFTMRYYF